MRDPLNSMSYSRALGITLLCLILVGFYGCFDAQVGTRFSNFVGGVSRLYDYVDTRVATGGIPWTCGMNSPAVFAPHGLVKLGPDTHSLGRTINSSGYYYPDTEVLGFSHTRYEGTGAWEGGILRALPSNQAFSLSGLKAYHPVFRHKDEIALPGYYKTLLKNYGIQVELTSTPHVGLHRYRFDQTDTPHVNLNFSSHLSRKGKVENIQVQVNSNQTLSGQITLQDDFSSRVGGITYFFSIYTSIPFTSHRFFGTRSDSTAASASEPSGTLLIDLLFSQTAGTSFELYVGLSLTSAAAAQANLDREVLTAGKTFSTVQSDTQSLWQARLSKIQITTSDEKLQRLFYSLLYRSFSMPTVISDARAVGGTDNSYLGFDKQEHLSDFYYYSELSLWDTFRTVHPLLTLIAPDVQLDVIKSMLAMATQSGRVPRWAAATGHADSMLGFPGHIMIVDSYLKGVTGFDTAFALSTMKAMANHQSDFKPLCLSRYIALGYCPAEFEESVSLTLEYSYSDYVFSKFASLLGDTTTAEAFSLRSKNYLNLWKESDLSFAPKKSSGEWVSPFHLLDMSYFSITEAAKHFTEGSPNQWRWYPHWDSETLANLFKGKLAEELNQFFRQSKPTLGMWYPSAFYWHGNEPDIHAAYLFNAVNEPQLTQYWVRWILENKHALDSKGIDGNDDGGTLSAWFVWAAIGLYPLVGTSRYTLSAPLFEQIDISVQGGTLRIRTQNFSRSSKYIRSVEWNGQRLLEPFIDHNDLRTGGDLLFELSDVPVSWRRS